MREGDSCFNVKRDAGVSMQEFGPDYVGEILIGERDGEIFR